MDYTCIFLFGVLIGYEIQYKLRQELVERFKNLLDDYYEQCRDIKKLKEQLKSKK